MASVGSSISKVYLKENSYDGLKFIIILHGESFIAKIAVEFCNQRNGSIFYPIPQREKST